MAIMITNYHCGACENGIVMVKKKETGNRVQYSFLDCNVCKASYGLTKIDRLKLVTNNIDNG